MLFYWLSSFDLISIEIVPESWTVTSCSSPLKKHSSEVQTKRVNDTEENGNNQIKETISKRKAVKALWLLLAKQETSSFYLFLCMTNTLPSPSVTKQLNWFLITY